MHSYFHILGLVLALAFNDPIAFCQEVQIEGLEATEASDNEQTTPHNIETIVAHLNEDGEIEIEDEILTVEQFRAMYPPVIGYSAHVLLLTDLVGGSPSIDERPYQVDPDSGQMESYHINLAQHLVCIVAGSSSRVLAAMREWERHTCVRFVPKRSTDSVYLYIQTKRANGRVVSVCSASLGYANRVRYVNLAYGCFNTRTLLHELGHTLGLVHEHQHPNRNRFIRIHWDNIKSGKSFNFSLRSDVSSWGVEYDPRSVMHYRDTAFRKSNCRSPCKTMESRTAGQLLGYATRLSTKSDIPIVKKLYNCPTTG